MVNECRRRPSRSSARSCAPWSAAARAANAPCASPTDRRRLQAQVGPYVVLGRYHGPHGATSLRDFTERDVMVPLTDATIAYTVGAILEVVDAATLIVNRELASLVPRGRGDLEPDHRCRSSRGQPRAPSRPDGVSRRGRSAIRYVQQRSPEAMCCSRIDVGAEDLGEQLELGLARGRGPRRDVIDRAVVLAQADRAVAAEDRHPRGSPGRPGSPPAPAPGRPAGPRRRHARPCARARGRRAGACARRRPGRAGRPRRPPRWRPAGRRPARRSWTGRGPGHPR